MESAGLPATQVHLAKMLGIEQPSISGWTKPGAYPQIARIVEIARKLDVCVEWLCLERGPMHVPPADPVSESMWGMWKRLNSNQRAQLVGFATGLSGGTPEPVPVLPHRSVEAARFAGEWDQIADPAERARIEAEVERIVKRQKNEERDHKRKRPPSHGDSPRST